MCSWSKGQVQKVEHGVPVPMLHEHHHANNGVLSEVSISGNETDCGVSTCSIKDSLGENGTHS